MRRRNLAQLVKDCYFENRRRYGSRRIKASCLNKAGIYIGGCRVRTLMREQCLRAIIPKKYVPRTTDSRGSSASPNLLKDLKLEECVEDKVIDGDITYIAMQGGKFYYLAIWQDRVTRRIIGWSLLETLESELMISALEKAITKGKVQAGAIIHSDQGSQYASNGFRQLLRRGGFRQSMSGKGKLL